MSLSRREFLKISADTGLSLAALSVLGNCQSVSGPLRTAGGYRIPAKTGDPDLIVRRGLIADGTGAPLYKADVEVREGIISYIGNLAGVRSKATVWADNMIVAPGFIDLHSHSDLILLGDGNAQSKIRQGVTSEIVGQDGRSVAPLNDEMYDTFRMYYGSEAKWKNFGGYYKELIRRGISVNVLSMVGAGTLRRWVAGNEKRPLTQTELQQISFLYRESIREGAAPHLSAGLEYLPGIYADESELAAIARSGKLYSPHMRNEDDHVLEAVKESVRIAREAGTALNITHLKAQGRRNWDQIDLIIAEMDRAREGSRRHRPLRVTCDRYPFEAYSSALINLFPADAREGGPGEFGRRLRDPHWQEIIRNGVLRKVESIGSWNDIQFAVAATKENIPLQGKRLGEEAARRKMKPYDFLMYLALNGELSAALIVFAMTEKNIEKLIKYPYCAIASDGAAFPAGGGGAPHPRNYGTFPQVLGRYVRERKIITVEEAVRKMTSLPAAIAGITDRGILKPGMAADIVVFDPVRVLSTSTYERPLSYPEGIPYVIVNGTLVVDRGDHTGAKPGGILKVI